MEDRYARLGSRNDRGTVQSLTHNLVKVAERGRFHDLLLGAAWRLFDHGDCDGPDQWCAVIVMCGSACDVAAAFALRTLYETDRQRPCHRLTAGKSRRLRELLRSKNTVNLK